MELYRALDQISEIHKHMARAEVSRDFRALPVGASGLLAFLAAALQSRVLEGGTPRDFVVYWVAVAALGLVVAGGGILVRYLRVPDEAARRRTRTVVGQFLPCMTGGALVTACLAAAGDESIPFLPGLWATLFSLGIFASRPYLPRAIGFVALGYLVAGGVLLSMADDVTSLAPAGMGLTFGAGQILAGVVLYWNLERRKETCE